MASDVLLSCELWHFLSFLVIVVSHQDIKIVTRSAALDDNWYFQIVEPHELSYVYKIRPSKNFGTNMEQSYYNIDLVLAEPYHACSPISNHMLIRNNIALVQRGECSFMSKAIQAELAGAAAVIITDHDTENDSRMIDMIGDDTDRNSHIPSFFLFGKDGYMISKLLRELNLPSAIINIPINATGIPPHRLNHPPWSLW